VYDASLLHSHAPNSWAFSCSHLISLPSLVCVVFKQTRATVEHCAPKNNAIAKKWERGKSLRQINKEEGRKVVEGKLGKGKWEKVK